MIVLDTHVWVWWVDGNQRLSSRQLEVITANETDAIGISAISCWEIAMLVKQGELGFSIGLKDWFTLALNYPGVRLIELTPEIAIESTQLPEEFHRDPADRIIVATARINNCALITSDNKILKYPHVQTI